MNDKINISQKIIDKYKHLGLNQDNLKVLIDQYNKYIASIVDKRDYNYKNIHNCSKHRVKMVYKGKRPPCHACKYVKRSMNILMDYMFVDKRDVSLDRLVFLLQNAFYNKLRLTRVNHMRLLASNLASMGNIMFSCADSPMFSFDTIAFVSNMIKSDDNIPVKPEERLSKRETLIKRFISDTHFDTISKLDKALLYYLVAFRFYIIAKLDKDACDCLLKILIIINNALTVAKSNPEYIGKLDNTEAKNNDKLLADDKSYKILQELFDTLFTRYAKLVNRQGAYSELSEFTDIRKILHLHDDEDINLTRTHLYSDLIEAIWHVIDSEIKMIEVIKAQGINKIAISDDTKDTKDVAELRIQIITDAYNHFKYIGMPHNTFYSEVIFYFARYNVNNYILEDILKISKSDNHQYNNSNSNEPTFGTLFLQKYMGFITSSENYCQYKNLFNINLSNVKDKQDLIEFLIEDSIICLSEILYKLTPFNHISSFSNHFVAGIYNSLWEYAKMYETLGLLYDFREFQGTAIFEELFRYWNKIKSSRDENFQKEISRCSPYISEGLNLRDKYGSLRNRMFSRLKHNIDDRTFKYTISNYAAEMALRYYSLVESGYYEGSAYRNQVSRNYLLNDDLDNDTWLFNTAIERFRINTNDIERRKSSLAKANTDSRFYRYESYVIKTSQEIEQFDIFDEIRFDDSLFTNTEL